MCVYSMICDHFYDKWAPFRQPQPTTPWIAPITPLTPLPSPLPMLPTPGEIEEFRRLLERARAYIAFVDQ